MAATGADSTSYAVTEETIRGDLRTLVDHPPHSNMAAATAK
jgi:hypothetical protein